MPFVQLFHIFSMTKKFFFIPALLIVFFSAVSVTHAASLCDPDVQRDWPSWIGQLGECAQQQEVVPVQRTRIPHIPEFYQPLTYQRLQVQPTEERHEDALQSERAGAQWWPDWIGKPEWY